MAALELEKTCLGEDAVDPCVQESFRRTDLDEKDASSSLPPLSVIAYTIGLPRDERMPVAKLNKHEIRTRETRELLLHAAETIFVRDGYEGAELSEIAALAGKTKGAIYAHFKSKEDIFLTLIAQRSQFHRNRMRQLLSQSTSIEQNLDSLRQLFLDTTIEDPTWSMLQLEFKLYAIRHPESQSRLQAFYEEVLAEGQESMYVRFLGESGQEKGGLSRTMAIRVLGPLLTSLAVESKLAPQLFDPSQMEDLAGKIFDMLLNLPKKEE